jgi:hypothetical protein
MAYRAFVDSLDRDASVSFYLDSKERFVRGVTPCGDEYVPLWSTETEASQWIDSWPAGRVLSISKDALIHRLADEVDASSMWFGLGLARSLLVTVHPVALRDDLRDRERSRRDTY